MRQFVTTDTHGERERFQELLRLAGFDYEEDEMVHLGDCVDRGPDSFGVIEELLKIKRLIPIRGNHDDWFNTKIHTGMHPAPAYFMECQASYCRTGQFYIPQSHKTFFSSQVLYYIDRHNRFFCHAGYDRGMLVEEQEEEIFYWDRDLFKQARSASEGVKLLDVNGFEQVFIGHTPTINWKKNGKKITTPIYAAQVVNLDTGGCFPGGKLSMLDITDPDNHVLYQS